MISPFVEKYMLFFFSVFFLLLVEKYKKYESYTTGHVLWEGAVLFANVFIEISQAY